MACYSILCKITFLLQIGTAFFSGSDFWETLPSIMAIHDDSSGKPCFYTNAKPEFLHVLFCFFSPNSSLFKPQKISPKSLRDIILTKLKYAFIQSFTKPASAHKTGFNKVFLPSWRNVNFENSLRTLRGFDGGNPRIKFSLYISLTLIFT